MTNVFAVSIIQPNNIPKTGATNANIATLLSILFITIGGLAVLMIIIAGLRYILAQGEPSKIESAKNTIIYSLIGLVISALAATIVNFVIGRL